jgi:Transcriptional regulators
MIPPGLTSVAIRKTEMGQVAARLLLGWMTSDTVEIPPRTVLPVTFVERGSVGPAPAAI